MQLQYNLEKWALQAHMCTWVNATKKAHTLSPVDSGGSRWSAHAVCTHHNVYVCVGAYRETSAHLVYQVVEAVGQLVQGVQLRIANRHLFLCMPHTHAPCLPAGSGGSHRAAREDCTAQRSRVADW